MDRWDDLLLKARVEMTGHQMRKEVTPEQAFDAAWDLVKFNLFDEQKRVQDERARKKAGRAETREAVKQGVGTALDATNRAATAVGEAGVGAAARAIPGIARGAGRLAGKAGNMGRAFKQGWSQAQQQRQARRAQGAPPTLQENAAPEPEAPQTPAPAEAETTRATGQPPSMASARDARREAEKGSRRTNRFMGPRIKQSGEPYAQRKPRQAAKPEPEQGQRALPQGGPRGLLPAPRSLDPSQVPMRRPPIGNLPAPRTETRRNRMLPEQSEGGPREAQPMGLQGAGPRLGFGEDKVPKDPKPKARPKQPDATVGAAEERQRKRAERRDMDSQGGGPLFSSQEVAPKPSSMADTPNRSEGPPMSEPKANASDALLPDMLPTGDGTGGTRIPFRSKGLRGATEEVHRDNPSEGAGFEQMGFVSQEEMDRLRSQGQISEREGTDRNYAVLDPNYGKKSNDDFSLLPEALRARLLKEQQPDTSVDYSLLPNGWSQGDLQ